MELAIAALCPVALYAFKQAAFMLCLIWWCQAADVPSRLDYTSISTTMFHFQEQVQIVEKIKGELLDKIEFSAEVLELIDEGKFTFVNQLIHNTAGGVMCI